MKVKEALEIAKSSDNQALIVLAKAYTIKNKIKNKPNNLDQKSIDKFFNLVDSNGMGERWASIQIANIRAYFVESFRGIFEVPSFPFISNKQIKEREQIEQDL